VDSPCELTLLPGARVELTGSEVRSLAVLALGLGYGAVFNGTAGPAQIGRPARLHDDPHSDAPTAAATSHPSEQAINDQHDMPP